MKVPETEAEENLELEKQPVLLMEEFPEWLPAMLVKDLRLALRSNLVLRAFVLQQLAFGVLTLVNELQRASGIAREWPLATFWGLLFFPVCVLLPMRCLNALQDEIRGGTLDVARLSGVSAAGTVWGKWLAAIAPAALTACGALPHLILHYFSGGLNMAAYFGAFAGLLLLCGAATALIITFSVLPWLSLRLLLSLSVAAGAGWLVSVTAASVEDLSITPDPLITWTNVISGGIVVSVFVYMVSLHAAVRFLTAPAQRSEIRERLILLGIFSAALTATTMTPEPVASLVALSVSAFIVVIFSISRQWQSSRLSLIDSDPLRRWKKPGLTAAILLAPGWHSARILSGMMLALTLYASEHTLRLAASDPELTDDLRQGQIILTGLYGAWIAAAVIDQWRLRKSPALRPPRGTFTRLILAGVAVWCAAMVCRNEWLHRAGWISPAFGLFHADRLAEIAWENSGLWKSWLAGGAPDRPLFLASAYRITLAVTACWWLVSVLQGISTHRSTRRALLDPSGDEAWLPPRLMKRLHNSMGVRLIIPGITALIIGMLTVEYLRGRAILSEKMAEVSALPVSPAAAAKKEDLGELPLTVKTGSTAAANMFPSFESWLETRPGGSRDQELARLLDEAQAMLPRADQILAPISTRLPSWPWRSNASLIVTASPWLLRRHAAAGDWPAAAADVKRWLKLSNAAEPGKDLLAAMIECLAEPGIPDEVMKEWQALYSTGKPPPSPEYLRFRTEQRLLVQWASDYGSKFFTAAKARPFFSAADDIASIVASDFCAPVPPGRDRSTKRLTQMLNSIADERPHLICERHQPALDLLGELQIEEMRWLQDESQRRLTESGFAVCRFRKARGSWPTALIDLAPDYLDAERTNPATGAKFYYDSAGGQISVFPISASGARSHGSFRGRFRAPLTSRPAL